MAKKKKSYRKKRTVKSTSPKHDLPSGFWSQVGALSLIAVSILFIVTWFNAGGPVLDWMYRATQATVGYAVYIIPALFTYIAIEIFRSEDNRLPFIMKLATVSAIIWFSALFGLLRSAGGQTTGGFVGDLINKGMLNLVNGTIAAFIYILLIAITLLFILKVTPDVVIKKIWQLGKRDLSDQEANIKVMRNAAAIDGSGSSSIGNLKISSSVPTMDPKEASELEKSKASGSKHEKPGEEQALVTISDPNWVSPSLDLLEKRQSPADAGDVQQNALTIKDTLDE
ncbi:MAG: DNA translocase FtsK 4TM domain-containing protein, partial [Anaerolineaceae bacterium]